MPIVHQLDAQHGATHTSQTLIAESVSPMLALRTQLGRGQIGQFCSPHVPRDQHGAPGAMCGAVCGGSELAPVTMPIATSVAVPSLARAEP